MTRMPLAPIGTSADNLEMSDEDFIRAWRLDGQRRALQPTSLRRRQDDLRCFARWWGAGLLVVDEGAIQRFLDARAWHGKPVGPRCRYKWVSTLATFYDWAIREGLVTSNPTARIIRPRLRRLLPRPWPAEDMEYAIAQGDATMRCWLLLAAYAGARCLELARLTREDVLDTWRPKVIVLRGKGAKDRTVPLHPRPESALAGLPMPRRGPVFLRPRGGAYTAAQVSQAVSAHFRALGMTHTAHQGRHWYGSQVLEASGGDIRLVQELLGHESITSTTIYTAWSRTKAARVVADLPVPPPREDTP